jgi:hypothetical protein
MGDQGRSREGSDRQAIDKGVYLVAATVQGPFMDSSNFRKRVLHKLAEELDLRS